MTELDPVAVARRYRRAEIAYNAARPRSRLGSPMLRHDSPEARELLEATQAFDALFMGDPAKVSSEPAVIYQDCGWQLVPPQATTEMARRAASRFADNAFMTMDGRMQAAYRDMLEAAPMPPEAVQINAPLAPPMRVISHRTLLEMPEIATILANHMSLIKKGDAYWRAGRRGYTTDREQAGLYTVHDAYLHIRNIDPDPNITLEVLP